MRNAEVNATFFREAPLAARAAMARAIRSASRPTPWIMADDAA